MLQNAPLLAIVAVHTAENEPSEVGDAATRRPARLRKQSQSFRASRYDTQFLPPHHH